MPSIDTALMMDPTMAFRAIGDEALICNPQSGLAHVVNQSAAQVLLSYKTGRSVPDAISALADQFTVTEEAIRDSVREITDHMLELGLLVQLDELASNGRPVAGNGLAGASRSQTVPQYLFDPPSQ